MSDFKAKKYQIQFRNLSTNDINFVIICHF